MILYVNGSTHTMAAEAINPYVTAGDDPNLTYLGQLPHPANLSVSWGKLLSLAIRSGFHCAAIMDNTIDQIIDDTKNWISQQIQNIFVVIEWPNITINDEEKIWQFHQVLNNQNIKHVFFNSGGCLSNTDYDWEFTYISPNGVDGTYERRLELAGIETVTPSSKHYGRDGHAYWNRFLINYIIAQNFL